MCDIYLALPTVAIFTRIPFEIRTSLADLGLAICPVVTDLTPDYTFLPVPDSHPLYSGSCWAPKGTSTDA